MDKELTEEAGYNEQVEVHAGHMTREQRDAYNSWSPECRDAYDLVWYAATMLGHAVKSVRKEGFCIEITGFENYKPGTGNLMLSYEFSGRRK